VNDKPDPIIYKEKKELLGQLIQLEDNGLIDLFFTDETGFSLTPSIPYGWQPVGEQVSIRSSRTKAFNLFGLLSRSGKLKTYSTKEYIDSDFVIECVDEIVLTIRRPTVLVMDNAPWHKSEKVYKKHREWEQKDLYVFYLPKYSPHLNLIETLWRKIKHEWLCPRDYESAKHLTNAVFNIIRNYDDEFCINFSKNFLSDG